MSTDKGQFKMYLAQEEIDRLQQLADRHGRVSKQALVEEVITIYLPLWKAVQEANERAVRYQTEQFPVSSQPIADVTELEASAVFEGTPKGRKKAEKAVKEAKDIVAEKK